MTQSMTAKHKVFVTGCAGFLGSHLVDHLIEQGSRVSGVDNFLTGSRRNVEHALGRGFTMSEHDIIDPWEGEADLVFNLACPASPPRYQANPLHTLRTSVNGSFNAAEFARKNSARLIHTSTSEIYGDPEQHPQTESYRGAVNSIGPRACYDEGKRAAETVLFDYKRMHDLSIGVVRIFNTYGPRMDPFDGRVVSNFIRQALIGEKITIYGDGNQTRSFCYVSDMIDGIWRLANSDLAGPVNIGNPVEYTILELAEEIRSLLGSGVDLVFEPLPVDDPKRRKPDIGLAKSELGWEPKVPLREGLRKTVDYFEDLICSNRLDHYEPVPKKFAMAGE